MSIIDRAKQAFSGAADDRVTYQCRACNEIFTPTETEHIRCPVCSDRNVSEL